ncbi:MAG: hypothetical protein ACRC8S_00005, partial [Fimbriiglobus sp.]
MKPRATYQPSGQTHYGEFLPFVVILFAVYGFIALGYALLVGQNLFPVGYIWMVSGALKSWLVSELVKRCHCRSPFLVALCCLVAGVMLFFGTYHLDQCLRWNVGWLEVDRIPGYITFRIETDSWWGPQKTPLIQVLPANPNIIPYIHPNLDFRLRWVLILVEFCVPFVPACVGWQAASRPYSERLKKWFTEETKILTPNSAKAFRVAMCESRLDHWAKHEVEIGLPDSQHPILAVMYCARSPGVDVLESEVYVKLDDGPTQLLEIEEVAAMTLVFPKLQEWCVVPVEEPSETIHQVRGHAGSDQYAIESKVPGEYVGDCSSTRLFLQRCAITVLALISP